MEKVGRNSERAMKGVTAFNERMNQKDNEISNIGKIWN
jgi:hypothetical protein